MSSGLVPLAEGEVLPMEPMTAVSELARALRLAAPSIRDPLNTAAAMVMILQNRGVFIVREGVPFQ